MYIRPLLEPLFLECNNQQLTINDHRNSILYDLETLPDYITSFLQEEKEKEMKEKEMKEKEMKAILQVQLEDKIQEMEENEEGTRRSARSNKGKYWYGKYKE